MPQLSNIIKTKELVLPNSQAKVMCKTTLTIDETLILEDLRSNNSSNRELGITMLLAVIKSWDFTDETGATLTITEENVRQIPAPDAMAIINYCGELAQTLRAAQQAPVVTTEEPAVE